MICEANHGWFAEMLHNGIRIFSTANLGSEPSRGSQQKGRYAKRACSFCSLFLLVRCPDASEGSHNGATISHYNTKVLDFQGLFVLLG